MNKISVEAAQLLYRKIGETHFELNLTPKEKIPKFRSLLERLFRALTEDVDQMFTDLLERMVFIQEAYNPPRPVVERMHALRSYANQVTHDIDFRPDDASYRICLTLLLQTVQYFSDAPPAESLLRCGAEADTPLNWKPLKDRRRIDYIDLRVLHLSDVHQNSYGKKYFEAAGFSPDLGRIRVVIRDCGGDHFGARLSELARMAWQFCWLRVFHVFKAIDKPDLYFTERNSYVALEPDYLISATDLTPAFAENEANPALFVLDRLMENGLKSPLLKGALANSLFDELIRNPEADTEALLEDALKNNALDVLELSQRAGARRDAHFLSELKAEVRALVKNLQTFAQGLRNSKLAVEPTFYSAKYGLTGRLDLLQTAIDSPNRFHVIELKSGKPPGRFDFQSVKSEHQAQLHCYAMLLETLTPNALVSGSALYAAARPSDEPLRMVYTSIIDRQNVMMARNELAAMEAAWSRNDWTALEAFLNGETGALPGYRKQEAYNFVAALQEAGQLEKAYFQALAAFAFRELKAAKVGVGQEAAPDGFAALWRQTTEEKIENHALLYYLELDAEASDFQRFHLVFHKSNLVSRRVSNFRAGDVILLYPMEANGALRPLNQPILKASVQKHTEESLTLSLRNKQTDVSFFDAGRFWAVEPDLLEQNYRSLAKQPFRFLTASARKRKLILGLREPEFDDHCRPLPNHLEPQMAAMINRALNARDYFLLQGPPGTGKTSVFLKELTRYLFHETQENVLVLAYTNRAADEICERLAELSLPFFRLGFSREKNYPALAQFTREKTLDQIHEYLLGCRVFVSTVASYLINDSRLTYKHFHTVIVDEASQILEGHLCGVLPDFDRFILLGDEKQLGAIALQPSLQVQTPAPQGRKLLEQIGLTQMGRSLFERLAERCQRMGWRKALGHLQCQYRMTPELMRYVNTVYYENRVVSAPENNFRNPFRAHSADDLERLLAQKALIFLDAPPEAHSRVHKKQAQMAARIARLANECCAETWNPQTLGIVSPYRAQIAEIHSRIPPHLQKDIRIDTVERFQGSQREIIIFSLAVNFENQLRYLQSLTADGKIDRKLNVALTRARTHLIILGSKDILQKSLHYRRLLDYLEENQAVFPLDFFLNPLPNAAGLD